MFKSLQSTVFILHFTPVCILLSVCSLHFTPGPQSAVCSPQSAFYTDRYIYICCLTIPCMFRWLQGTKSKQFILVHGMQILITRCYKSFF